MSFQTIVEEIMATHHSLLKRELPKISEQIAALSAENPDNDALTEAAQIYGKVRNKVETHLKDEEMVLFPSGIALERGGTSVPTEMNLVERLAEMEKEHDGCGKTLTSIQKTIATTVPTSERRDQLLANIQLIQDDFVVHVEKENSQVHPMFLQLLSAKR
ncbi:MAG: hemerythrin domain-containing protein [Cyanobacteria bacterium REEB67]|nr:hemerythrin domain-containing protein [Cyanobacteria bacterium REEB67]